MCSEGADTAGRGIGSGAAAGFVRRRLRPEQPIGGAAMSPGDTLALAFGLNVGANHIEQFYYKQPHQSTWTNLTAGENLGHDFYYPYVVVEDSNYWLLPIQDDYNPATGGNFYQIIPIFSYDGTDWTQEIIIDLTSHALASERERLLSQCDLFQDSNGTIHVYYNELLDESVAYHSSAIKHVHNGNGTWESTGSGLSNMMMRCTTFVLRGIRCS